MFKKIMALALCVVMVLSFATVAQAEGVTWEYNSTTKVLTIKGSGKMTSAPWNDEIDVTKVEKIVIENGVTSICDNAFVAGSLDEGFEAYTSLTAVEIPESVISIGERAFGMAENLTDVKLPSNLKKLGMVAFLSTGIKEVTIPKTLTEWHRTTFGNCMSLESVTIEKGVTKIPDFAFYNTAVKAVTIPESIVSIGEYAFAGCTSLENIYIPRGVVTIGGYAFDECASLKEIYIPETVKILNDSLNNWYIEKVEFGGSKAEWEKIEGNSIGNGTELVCRNEVLNYTLTANEDYTALSWNNYPGATGYELAVFAYNKETDVYDYVQTHAFDSATTFTMEDYGYEDGLYCANLWVYMEWTQDMDFSDMMWMESIYFSIGESRGQDTYAVTGVKMKQLEDGNFFVEAEVVERANRSNRDMFVIAVYEDGVMIDMTYMTANLITGIPFSFGGILEGGEDVEIRAFVWESMDNMKNLSNVVSGIYDEFAWD